MAVYWIKIEHVTPDKTEVVQMAAQLRIDQDAVVGKLLRVWIWADQNSVDGVAVAVTDAFIDRLVNKRGFASALRSVHWLDGKDGALNFRNFSRHNGDSAKRRAMEQRKKNDQRERDKHPDDVPDFVPDPSGQTTGPKGGPDRDIDKDILNLAPPASRSGASATPPLGDSQAPERAPRGKQKSNAELEPLGWAALCCAEGSKPAEMTWTAQRRVDAALGQILDVSPRTGVELACEITTRAKRYRHVMPKDSKLTAHALAANWAKCGTAITPPTTADNEPSNWREIAKALAHRDEDEVRRERRLEAAHESSWASIAPSFRTEIFAEIKARKHPAA